MKPASGSTEIRQVYAKAMADPAFQIRFASDRIDVAGSGDLAYARGHFTEKYTDPKTQKVMTDSGSYVTVYKKQSDGGWKAVEDFAAADPDQPRPSRRASRRREPRWCRCSADIGHLPRKRVRLSSKASGAPFRGGDVGVQAGCFSASSCEVDCAVPGCGTLRR